MTGIVVFFLKCNSLGKMPEAKLSTCIDESLYCTPCARQFTNASVYTAHLPGKKHVKNSKNPSKGDGIKDVIAKEHLIMSCMSILSEIQKDTYQRVEAKSMLTDDERQALLDEDSSAVPEAVQVDEGEEKDDGVDDDRIYNPLKLPLGWDGI
jgi:splicing factor 3A subunit 3